MAEILWLQLSLFKVVAVIVYVECCSVGDINRREDPQVLWEEEEEEEEDNEDE